MKLTNLLPLILGIVFFVTAVGGAHILRDGPPITEEQTLKEVGKDLSDLHKDILKEQQNSPIPMWQCGNPPTIVPVRGDYQDIKEFHIAVADFRAHSYAWMSCATEFAAVYPSAVVEWSLQLIEEDEVIIQ